MDINMSVNSFMKSFGTHTDLCFVWWNVDVSTTAGTLGARQGFGVTVHPDTQDSSLQPIREQVRAVNVLETDTANHN